MGGIGPAPEFPFIWIGKSLPMKLSLHIQVREEEFPLDSSSTQPKMMMVQNHGKITFFNFSCLCVYKNRKKTYNIYSQLKIPIEISAENVINIY